MMGSLVFFLAVICFATYTGVSLIILEDESAYPMANTLFTSAAVLLLVAGENQLCTLSRDQNHVNL